MDKTINNYYLKIAGAACLLEAVEEDHTANLMAGLEIYSIEDKDNQDGTEVVK